MSKLFSPLILPSLTLENRIVVSPMCQYSSRDGFASDWHLVHLGQFAIGKAAAVIQEATAVSAAGRISYGDLGIYFDEHIENYRRICAFIKSQGSVPGIQLAHAGRKASTEKPWLGKDQYAPTHPKGWQTVGPSDKPFEDGQHPPRALRSEEIMDIIDAFRKAAARAVQAGYEIIEIHGAHGYLLHQFLSPLVNRRQDDYGGSFENRIRLLLQVVDAIREELKGQSLWVRLSATDWADGGWDLAETIALSRILKDRGVELVDISSGGAVSHQQIQAAPNYQVPFAEAIKKQAKIAVGAVGIITKALQAEEIIQTGKADIVLIAREFLRDPHLVFHWAKELGVELEWPPQYARAKR